MSINANGIRRLELAQQIAVVSLLSAGPTVAAGIGRVTQNHERVRMDSVTDARDRAATLSELAFTLSVEYQKIKELS